jgi:hypothetical protein
MKFLLLSILFLLCTGAQGPRGIQGPRGLPGEKGVSGNCNVRFYDTTGILPEPNEHDYWNIYLPYQIDDDSTVVQTWIRLNKGFLWSQPVSWYYSSYGYVRIVADAKDIHALEGSEFKINVIYYY